MNITEQGLIMALKNIGVFLGTHVLTDIKGDPYTFLFQLVVFCLINVPTDLFMLNHFSDKLKGDKDA